MDNLRVLVVPTETDNDINKWSTLEEILVCDETKEYTLIDYFNMQNDEEVFLHWTFLYDKENNVLLNSQLPNKKPLNPLSSLKTLLFL